MGNQCCKNTSTLDHQQQPNPSSKLQPHLEASKKKDYSNYASYGKIKEQNNQMIANKSLRVQKYNTDIANANVRLQEKVKEQAETKKDMSFQIRKIQNEIQSLKKLRDTEERAISNLREM